MRARIVLNALAIGVLLLVGLARPELACAHASLLSSEPEAGAVLAQAPKVLRLSFNEPVTPLVMRLIGPDGEAVTPAFKAENTSVTITPPALRRGTSVLSWRVISADGHPVGGSVVFSVGAPSNAPTVGSADTDRAVDAAIWVVRLAIYLGLFIGIGGAAFIALIAEKRPLPGRTERWITAALAGGLVASVLSLGLQGLDALAQPLSQIWRPDIWATGLGTSYGATAIIAALSLVLALAAMHIPRKLPMAVCTLAALAGSGLALAASGHAGTVEPQLASRPAVFVHTVCVALWVGSLLPLVAIVRNRQRGNGELARFSRWIPIPLVLLVATGAYLTWIELDRPDALWTTRYGEALSVKLAGVLALLVLAAANRYRLVPHLRALQPGSARPLALSIAVESMIAVAVLGTVALWRFTPPPRGLIAAEASSIHFHGGQAMAQIDVDPVRARGADVSIEVLDREFRPLTAKEVTIFISNPAAGIEPVRRVATNIGGPNWRIDDFRIPVGGIWSLRVDILIDDFDKVTLEDNVVLPRAP